MIKDFFNNVCTYKNGFYYLAVAWIFSQLAIYGLHAKIELYEEKYGVIENVR